VTVFLITAWAPQGYIEKYGFVPSAPRPATVFSSTFIHAGVWHLFGNMVFLVLFGRPVEPSLGSGRFAVSYLSSGIAASLLHAWTTPSPAVPLVGASGAIAGVVGVFFVLFPREPVDLHVYLLRWQVATRRTTGLVAISVWFGEQLALGAISAATGAAIGIAFWAHVGGFVAGALIGFLLGRLAFG
jgi:membrane associated rhomboid family serine protease